jgi:hypothetical protein
MSALRDEIYINSISRSCVNSIQKKSNFFDVAIDTAPPQGI